jgi:hypothetical protein
MSDPADDPGRFWRRVARIGALAVTAITFYPLNSGSSVGQIVLHDVLTLFGNPTRNLIGNSSWPYFFLMVGSTSIVLCGPAMLLACSSRTPVLGARRTLSIFVVFVVFLLNALIPFCVLLRLLSSQSESETARAFGIAASLVYLIVHGLVALVTLQKKRRFDLPFWCGLTVLGTNLLAWASVVVYGLFARGLYTRDDWYLMCPEFLSALFLFVGWVMWWRAVKLAQPSARSPIQNPQSEIVNPPPSC